jgi:hypothetical protein
MTCTGRILITGIFALGAAACGVSTPTAPSAGPSVTTGAFAVAESSARPLAGSSIAAASCTVDVGATTHPLPAFHVYVNWLNQSIADAGSDLTCGQVNSLDAKMELLAKALDENPPAFETACGLSLAVAREIDALINSGDLAVLTFPEPVPGGPTTLEQIAEELSGNWCAAARGDLVGPR